MNDKGWVNDVSVICKGKEKPSQNIAIHENGLV